METLLSPSLETGKFQDFASEVKFVVDLQMAERIREWARLNLEADPFGGGRSGDVYTITSLYLDTENFDVLRRVGSFGRGKYRIRRYGASPEIFLERKMKSRGLISKKRTVVGVEDLPRVGEMEANRGWAGYWYHRRLLARRLKPVCQISYSRTARVARSATGAIRLTVDENIAAVRVSGPEFDITSEPVLLSEGRAIVELKFRKKLPVLFEEFMKHFELKPQAASKYRMAGAALGFGTTE